MVLHLLLPKNTTVAIRWLRVIHRDMGIAKKKKRESGGGITLLVWQILTREDFMHESTDFVSCGLYGAHLEGSEFPVELPDPWPWPVRPDPCYSPSQGPAITKALYLAVVRAVRSLVVARGARCWDSSQAREY